VLFSWGHSGALDAWVGGNVITNPTHFGFGGAAEDGGVIYQGCTASAGADTLGTSDNSRRIHENATVVMFNSSTFATIASATTTFTATGFTLTFGTNDNVARNIAYLAIGGGGAFVRAKIIPWAPTATGSLSISTIGFQPTVGIDFFAGSLNTANGSAAGAGLTLGIRSASASYSFAYLANDAAATAVTTRGHRGDSMLVAYPSGNAQVANTRFTHTSWDPAGFTVNAVALASARRCIGIFMAGVDVSVGMTSKPTGAAGSTQDITTPGWTPEAVVLLTDHDISRSGVSSQVSNVGGGFGVGFSSGSQEAAVAGSDVHGPTAMVTKALVSGSRALVKSENTAPSTQAAADLSTLANGFRLTWAVNDAVATEFGYLALRETPVGVNTPKYYSYIIGTV
jgi:hypothetical protein